MIYRRYSGVLLTAAVVILAGCGEDTGEKASTSSTACMGDSNKGGICAEPGGCGGSGNLIAAASDEGKKQWNNGQNKDTGADSSSDGFGNTKVLAGTDGGDPNSNGSHPAAEACASKSQNGHSDWYLPAKSELDTLYQDLVDEDGDDSPTGDTYNFDTSGLTYWSSTEFTNGLARKQRFSDGNHIGSSKSINSAVRCVRRSN